MSVTDRQTLHDRLDALIDRRDEWLDGRSVLDTSIERSHPSLLDDDMDPEHPADLLYISILAFAADLAGRYLREEVAPLFANDGSDQRRALRWILRLLRPCFPKRSRSRGEFFRTLHTEDVSRALRSIDAGHPSPMFAPTSDRYKADIFEGYELLAIACLSMKIAQENNGTSNTVQNREEVGNACNVSVSTLHNWGRDFSKVIAGKKSSVLGKERVADTLARAPSLDVRSLAHIIFGQTVDAPHTVKELGARYQTLDRERKARNRGGARKAKNKSDMPIV